MKGDLAIWLLDERNKKEERKLGLICAPDETLLFDESDAEREESLEGKTVLAIRTQRAPLIDALVAMSTFVGDLGSHPWRLVTDELDQERQESSLKIKSGVHKMSY